MIKIKMVECCSAMSCDSICCCKRYRLKFNGRALMFQLATILKLISANFFSAKFYSNVLCYCDISQIAKDDATYRSRSTSSLRRSDCSRLMRRIFYLAVPQLAPLLLLLRATLPGAVANYADRRCAATPHLSSSRRRRRSNTHSSGTANAITGGDR